MLKIGQLEINLWITMQNSFHKAVRVNDDVTLPGSLAQGESKIEKTFVHETN